MSDHNSSPRGVAEPAIDIGDLYVFPSPDRPGRLDCGRRSYRRCTREPPMQRRDWVPARVEVASVARRVLEPAQLRDLVAQLHE